ncbi:MAG TPA: hypothetical protein VMX36_11125 [Sedimentisphaerales bacterium]|nr:hypothetical protein [Sedimentisphaerales bacterium]
MKKHSFKPIFKIVLLSVVSLSVFGCSGTLEQKAQTVRVSPVSEEYRLTERIEGRTYILLAETRTGQEQHRSDVSDSLARALEKGYERGYENSKSSLNIKFLGFGNKPDAENIPNERLEVLSFTDLANRLNEKGICQRHAEMRKFYRENGMFRKSDLEFLAKEIGADYLILPCLLDIKRWSQGRLSVVGVKFLQTQIVSGMLGMEIWDTRTGHKVFSATSDVTLANERIKEEPIAMEEAFESAWLGIMKELPGYPALAEEQNPGKERDPAASTSSYVKKGEGSEYEIERLKESQGI